MAKGDDSAVLLEHFPMDGVRVDASTPTPQPAPKKKTLKKKTSAPSKTADRRLERLKKESNMDHRYRSFRADVLEMAMSKDKDGYDRLVASSQELFGSKDVHVPPYELPAEKFRRPRPRSAVSRLFSYSESVNDGGV